MINFIHPSIIPLAEQLESGKISLTSKGITTPNIENIVIISGV
jgi:hypothetical protein